VPDPSDSQQHNRYSYVGNNPVVRTDPSGHDPVTNTSSTSRQKVEFGNFAHLVIELKIHELDKNYDFERFTSSQRGSMRFDIVSGPYATNAEIKPYTIGASSAVAQAKSAARQYSERGSSAPFCRRQGCPDKLRLADDPVVFQGVVVVDVGGGVTFTLRYWQAERGAILYSTDFFSSGLSDTEAGWDALYREFGEARVVRNFIRKSQRRSSRVRSVVETLATLAPVVLDETAIVGGPTIADVAGVLAVGAGSVLGAGLASSVLEY